MSLKIIKKQTAILFLSVLMLGLFVFATYFYWVPDNLVPFLPENVLFYAHLNLNDFHYSGHLTQKWFKSNINEVGSLFKEYSIDLNIIDYLEEVALFVLPGENIDSSQLGLLIKTKAGQDDLQDLLPPSFFVKQISDQIFIASPQIDLSISDGPISFSKENRFQFINPFSKEPSLAQGYVNLDLMSAYLPIKKQFLRPKFVGISILYHSYRDNRLFFEIEDKNSFDYSLLSSNFSDFSIPKKTFGFAFIFPKQRSLEELENRVKAYLALQRPRERKVVLPDNSFFTEIVIDPQNFIFKKEGLIDYWQDFSDDGQEFLDNNLEIAFAEDQKHTFFSNNHILLREIMTIEREEDSISNLYWEIDNFWLQRLVIQEKSQKIKGFWELKKF